VLSAIDHIYTATDRITMGERGYIVNWGDTVPLPTFSDSRRLLVAALAIVSPSLQT